MIDEIKIDKDVPLPENFGLKNIYTKAIKVMKVGENFTCSVHNRAYIGQFANRHKIKIITRKEGDKIRVWRIE